MWTVPEPAMCRIEPGQLALLRQQADAEARGDDLKRALASVNDEIGRNQLQCPIPTAEAALQAPVAPPAPAPHADLPQEEWDRHDLTLLEGCWHNVTQMNTRMIETGQIFSVENWQICFDRAGHGRQTIRWNDGVRCTGPATATFANDNDLVMTDLERCRSDTGGRFVFRGKFACTRISDNEATCIRTGIEGQSQGDHQAGRFVR